MIVIIIIIIGVIIKRTLIGVSVCLTGGRLIRDESWQVKRL